MSHLEPPKITESTPSILPPATSEITDFSRMRLRDTEVAKRRHDQKSVPAEANLQSNLLRRDLLRGVQHITSDLVMCPMCLAHSLLYLVVSGWRKAQPTSYLTVRRCLLTTLAPQQLCARQSREEEPDDFESLQNRH